MHFCFFSLQFLALCFQAMFGTKDVCSAYFTAALCTQANAATPSSGAARRENGVTHKSEVSDYFKSSLSTLGPSDMASFPDKYGARLKFSPDAPRHLTE